MVIVVIVILVGKGIFVCWLKLIDWFWDFDKVVVSFVWGFLWWMNCFVFEIWDSFCYVCK